MNDQYFGWPDVIADKRNILLMLKLRLFGEKIVEHSPSGVTAVWYAYKGKLYMTDYSIFA